MKRKCEWCSKEYDADNRNVKPGWELCYSKPFDAKKREKKKEKRKKRRGRKRIKEREGEKEEG